jgi:hypothetical protein
VTLAAEAAAGLTLVQQYLIVLTLAAAAAGLMLWHPWIN